MEAEPSGVVLLTQIVPQPHAAAASAPLRPLRKLYQGEPLALGITQILTGVVQVAFGIILILVDNTWIAVTHLGTPIWTGMLYIISGSLCVAAAKNPKISLVKGALAMNTLSAVAAGVSIIVTSLSLIYHYPYQRCYGRFCESSSEKTVDVMRGVVMILLVFTLLEFCVSIASAAFGCKTVCRDSYSDMSVVVYQNMGLPAAPANEPPNPHPHTRTPRPPELHPTAAAGRPLGAAVSSGQHSIWTSIVGDDTQDSSDGTIYTNGVTASHHEFKATEPGNSLANYSFFLSFFLSFFPLLSPCRPVPIPLHFIFTLELRPRNKRVSYDQPAPVSVSLIYQDPVSWPRDGAAPGKVSVLEVRPQCWTWGGHLRTCVPGACHSTEIQAAS
ncbi:membrane-spanning 4-domains subfamily A member 8-like [Emydura macquarii macquarii]|uniref:membrane-spanning 4-domains subfamily A member 8-like n=1 Tax=Emydura macquarii macquarii TaxID=1129001 RepID=UPI00352B6F61